MFVDQSGHIIETVIELQASSVQACDCGAGTTDALLRARQPGLLHSQVRGVMGICFRFLFSAAQASILNEHCANKQVNNLYELNTGTGYQFHII